MKKSLFATIIISTLVGCSAPEVHDATTSNELPTIFPDYKYVTVPATIAPLNFSVGNAEAIDITIDSNNGQSMRLRSRSNTTNFDIDEWHKLLAANIGSDIKVTVNGRKNGQWTTYKPFNITISTDSIDYGLTYRLIAPGYEVYGRMGIYERDLSNFDQKTIFESTQSVGICINCHTANRANPSQSSMHFRGPNGATIIRKDGKMTAYNMKSAPDSLGCVYTYWHPDGRYIAYSQNNTLQSFHMKGDERIEVFDTRSDVSIFDTETDSLIRPSCLHTTDYETFPAFSPDGKTLYYCTSQPHPVPQEYKDIKYNLCRVSFDAATGTIGNDVDTLIDARAEGKSIAWPRPSYDGRFIVYTLIDYGQFSIWHREADLYVYDTQTGTSRPLTAANSDNTEAFHNWSSNSRWLVFTSRRIDGLYTRAYITHIDEDGNASKPFLLPQSDPSVFYSRLMMSYNTPDFCTHPTDYNAKLAEQKLYGDRIVAK